MTAGADPIFAPATRVFWRNWLVYRRIWYRSLFFGFLQPFLFLTAMGLGIGSLIGRNTQAFGAGVTFTDFLGPGLMAAMAMQTATFESTYPIMNKIQWGRNYEAMLSTPLATRNIVAGELGWIGFRLLAVGAIFLTVLTIFGITRTPWALLALPVVVVTGLGFSSNLMAFTTTQQTDIGFSWIFRFVINPLFLFSGTFFPLSQLPGPLQAVAWATPLFHAAELTRGLVLGRLDLATAPFHVAYLLAFLAIGIWLADRGLARRMVA
ncbi:MAG TPA: ABC transporter permease [Candidatus Limnocylindria bacterium]|nr:ABC transporter permease [Candidatus Limnocylindria bacterium]